MKRIYFVRHGESEANAAKVHGGPHHPLTERGKEQARFIAERCSKLPLEALWASTMVRARQTGEVIANKTGLSLRLSDLFVEVRGPTEFNERPIHDPDIIAAFLEVNKRAAPGYRHSDEENFDDLIERATKALKFLCEQPEEHIAVVTHGLFLRVLLTCALFGVEATSRELFCMSYGLKSENTGLTILEYRPDTPEAKWRLWVWNDHAHLAE